MQPTGISIVIPAYNEEKFLPHTLASLQDAANSFAGRYQRPWEIIVVNNLSTDGTVAVAERLGARVVNHDQRNIASVRNAGIREARYGVIVTVDADNKIPPHTLEHIWEAMTSGRYVGGGVRVAVDSKSGTIRMLVRLIDRALLYGAGVSAGLFFFAKSAADAIQGFPENYLVGEDTAFALALKKHGRKQGLKFCHLHSVTLLTADRKKITPALAFRTIWNVGRQLAGRPVTREQLEFWYRPDR